MKLARLKGQAKASVNRELGRVYIRRCVFHPTHHILTSPVFQIVQAFPQGWISSGQISREGELWFSTTIRQANTLTLSEFDEEETGEGVDGGRRLTSAVCMVHLCFGIDFSPLDAFWIQLLYCTTIFVRALLSLFLRLYLPRFVQFKPSYTSGRVGPTFQQSTLLSH